MRRTRAWMFLPVALLFLSGCSIFSRNTVRVSQQTVGLSPVTKTTLLKERHTVKSKRKGGRWELGVSFHQDCELQTTKEYQVFRVKRIEGKNVWLAFGVGILGVGGGIAAIFVGPEYLGRGPAYTAGGVLGAVGLYALIEGFVVLGRSGTKRTLLRRRFQKTRQVKPRCRVAPFAKRHVHLMVGSKTLFRGQTSSSGQFSISVQRVRGKLPGNKNVKIVSRGSVLVEVRRPDFDKVLDAYWWPIISKQKQKSGYLFYLSLLPRGSHAKEVRHALAAMALASARKKGNHKAVAYRRIVQKFSGTAAAEEARKLLEKSLWVQVLRNRTEVRLRSFLREFPKGRYALIVRRWLEAMVWRKARRSGLGELKSFLQEFPSGAHATQARQIVQNLERRRQLVLWRNKLREAKTTGALYQLYRSAPAFFRRRIIGKARRFHQKERRILRKAASLIDNSRASQYKVYVCSYSNGTLYYRMRLSLLGGIGLLTGGGRGFWRRSMQATSALNRLFRRIRGVRQARLYASCSKPWYY